MVLRQILLSSRARSSLRVLWAGAFFLPCLAASAGVVFTNLYSFLNGPDGAFPEAGLVQGADGYLYGTTYGGGATNHAGTVFKITPGGALTTLHAFTGASDAGFPCGPLVQGTDGCLYGTTTGFGAPNYHGSVFKITTNGAFTSLYSFTGGPDGSNPEAGLVQGSDGFLYGVANFGGSTNWYGTVFKISTNGALSILHIFTGPDGVNPYTDGLAQQGSDGNFYGATLLGGTIGQGTVYKISPSGAFTSLYSFGGDPNSPVIPKSGLVQGRDGNFYGTSEEGGTNNSNGYGYGTVFRITTNGVLTTMASFNGTNGAYPMSPLVQAVDGNFYGTTSAGGANGSGTVFKMTPSGELTSLYSFASGPYNEYFGGLVQGTDGSFYGTTPRGGTLGYGNVFRLTVVPPAAPVIQSVTQTNGTLTLTWTTEAGAVYQPQFLADLSSTNWTNLGPPITASGTTLGATDSIANASQRFYRVALLP